MERRQVPAGTIWEEKFGYSRAVRVGSTIHVSGTAGSDEKGETQGGAAYGQAVYVLQRIEGALAELGASMADVVRTRVFLTDIADWEQVAKAHAEYFGSIKPASTLVEVSRLIEPDLVVEIEAEAIVTD